MKDRKEWFYRASRTFFQGVLAYLVVAVPALLNNNVSVTKTALIGAGVTALMAGVAAVMNIKPSVPNDESNTEVNGEIAETPAETDAEIIEESAGEG